MLYRRRIQFKHQADVVQETNSTQTSGECCIGKKIQLKHKADAEQEKKSISHVSHTANEVVSQIIIETLIALHKYTREKKCSTPNLFP